MAILRCPKCNSVRVEDAPAGQGWKTCARCSNTWLHREDAEAEGPPAAVAAPRVREPGTEIGPPDYSPDSFHDADDVAAAQDPLTLRMRSDSTDRLRPHSEVITGESESLQPRAAAESDVSVPSSPPSPPPAPRTSGDDSSDRRRHEDSSKVELDVETGGSQMAVDLFDSIEREIDRERGSHRTRHDEADAVPLRCPSCDHQFSGLASADSVTCPQCGSEVSTDESVEPDPVDGQDPLIGKEIRGCRVDRKIGEGGMGAVYHARQLSLDRSVAIKVLPPELKRDKKFLHRFEQEAKSLARINHPNIMHVYDFGEEDRLGIYFMTMEFVDGLDLAEVLRQRRRIPQLEVVDMLRQSALGLQQAASKGVVHRDIKPDNLMVTADGVWKVSDFGLAKQNDAIEQVTRAGIRVGTPAFMSPEQCDGKPLDFRSDVYSLGVTAYTALTGRLPFDGESPFAIMLKHKTQIAKPLRELVDDIDPRVAEIVARMMAKDAEQRAESWQVLIDDLAALLEQLNPGVRASMSGGHSALASPSSRLREAGRPASSDRIPLGQAVPPASESSGELPPVPDDLVFGDQRAPRSERALNLAPQSPSPTAVPILDAGAGRGPTPDGVPSKKMAPAPKPTGELDDLPDSAAVGSAVDALLGGLEDPVAPPPAPASPPAAPPRPTRRPSPPRPEGRGAAARASSGRNPSPGAARRSGENHRASARQRQRQREFADLEAEGDEALAQGRAKRAHKAYVAALQRVDDPREKRGLVAKAEEARRQVGRKRRRRILVGLLVIVVLGGLGLWLGVPPGHAWYAEREWHQVDHDDAAAVAAYVERHGQWRSWYSQVLPSYELASLDEARARLAELEGGAPEP